MIERLGTGGFCALDPDLVNFAFLFPGSCSGAHPRRTVGRWGEGVRGAAGIILRFPFYAGILAMMKSTGLLARSAEPGAAAGKGSRCSSRSGRTRSERSGRNGSNGSTRDGSPGIVEECTLPLTGRPVGTEI